MGMKKYIVEMYNEPVVILEIAPKDKQYRHTVYQDASIAYATNLKTMKLLFNEFHLQVSMKIVHQVAQNCAVELAALLLTRKSHNG